MTVAAEHRVGSAAELLAPVTSEVAAGFWEACRHGRLTVQTCGSCGARRFPPTPMCPECASVASTWEPIDGDGTVWSFVAPEPPLLPAYAALAPYVAAVVELAADPAIRMVGRLVAPDGAAVAAADVAIGDRVSLTFVDQGGAVLPCWIHGAVPTAEERS